MKVEGKVDDEANSQQDGKGRQEENCRPRTVLVVYSFAHKLKSQNRRA